MIYFEIERFFLQEFYPKMSEIYIFVGLGIIWKNSFWKDTCKECCEKESEKSF